MSSIIQPSIRTLTSSELPLSLKQGQVFHGSVKKLLPGDMAEVLVGNQKMLAKLEVPLKAGDAYFFQVTSAKADLRLKVVTGNLQPGTTNAGHILQLMASLQLPKSAEMQTIMQHMVKEKIPISKDWLMQAEQMMKNLPTQIKMSEGLLALQKMSELKSPITDEIFRAVISGQDKSGLHYLFDTLRQALQNDTSIPLNQRESIVKLLTQMSQPFAKELGGAIIGQVIESLLSTDLSASDQAELLDLLKGVGLVPKQATPANWLSQQTTIQSSLAVQSTPMDQLLKQILQPALDPDQLKSLQNEVQQSPFFKAEDKHLIQQLIDKVSMSTPKTPEWSATIQALTNEIIKAFAEASQSQPFQTDQKSFTPKEHVLSILTSLTGTQADSKALAQLTQLAGSSTQPTVQQAFATAEAAIQSGINRNAVELAMKQILGEIGLSYEAKLMQQGTQLSEISNSLKPQLIALLQNHAITTPVREAAESIVSRFNGLQILSGENGPQSQLLMQVPLDFLGKRIDATLQWNGRMRDDGKIDSDYARVMFYLDLASLKETVIDMQVQNRVITINIYNESDAIQPYAEPFKEALKTGLNSLNYQLSGVLMKSFFKQPASQDSLPKVQSSTGGVDIRI